MFNNHSKFLLFLVCTVVLYGGCQSSLTNVSSVSPGTMKGNLKVDNKNRSYRLHIPEGYASEKPLPLVIALHGAFSSAREMERLSGFSALADEEGFVVVYPNGIGLFGFLRHWNAGFCCGRAMDVEWNDTGFLLGLIDLLTEHLVIDKQRIYLVGMSNGGMLAHRFAAEYPDRIAAVTLVSAAVGARWEEGEMKRFPPPLLPVPALIIHTKDDPVIPFEGGRGSRRDVEYLGALDAVAFWRGVNRCESIPVETLRVQGGNWTLWKGYSSGAEVALLAVDQGGHVWPGERRGADQCKDGADATKTAWRFMSRFFRD